MRFNEAGLRNHLAVPLAVFALFAHTVSLAAVCSSVAAGPFQSASAWDCNCNPSACDTVIISHNITSAVDLTLINALLVVNDSGMLQVSGRLAVNAVNVVVNGSMAATTMEWHLADSLINQGVLVADSFLFFEGDLVNYGSLDAQGYFGVAFFPVSYEVRNYGSVQAGDVFCARYFLNQGLLVCHNAHLMIYYSSMGSADAASVLMQSTIGIGEQANFFVSDTLQIVQSFEDYGFVQCGHFVNGWSIGTAQSQVFAGGVLQCGTFLNQSNGFMSGPGTICIAGHSENHGTINAPITICDISLDVVAPPYMDVNTGGFLQPIAYCNGDACATVEVQETSPAHGISLSPNPSVGNMLLDLDGSSDVARIELLDGLGRLVLVINAPYAGPMTITRDGLDAGAYAVVVRDSAGTVLTRAKAVFVDH